MTIDAVQAIGKNRKELITFMSNFWINAKLVAKLLNLKPDTIYQMRFGSREISQEQIDFLKKSYKEYMYKQLEKL
ncbi:MAG: hypothetical protein PVJ67_03990 [Candidatus Pacearchaeota archaeon]|jgi:hypothetical protein